MQRIAVWNTAFLGDTVLTLPLLRVLHAAFPHAELDFYVRQGFDSLYTAQPELAQVIGYAKRGAEKGGSGLWRMARTVRHQAYDAFICAHQSPRSALISRMSGAPLRVGYQATHAGARLLAATLKPYTHTVDRCFGQLHEIERLLELARPLCSTALVDDPALHWPELVLPTAARESATTFWTNYLHGPVLGLHPGSVWATKRWTPDGFATLTKRAVQAGANVLLFAGPGEEAMAHEVLHLANVPSINMKALGASCVSDLLGNAARHSVPPSVGDSPSTSERGVVFDLSNALTLPQLAAFLGKLNVYVSNDSGPLHLAWVQRTPVSALFGPTTESLGFFPRGTGATVHQLALPCRPCSLHGPVRCPLGHHRCMTELNVDSVWKDVEHKLFA